MKFKYSNKYLLSNRIGDSNIMVKNVPIVYDSNKLCENIKVYKWEKIKNTLNRKIWEVLENYCLDKIYEHLILYLVLA
jgi:predicted house-cleaning noncanonical NTP pyrophosphatase (MazG superfamily)